MRVGIICPAEIAFRRFMPAITKLKQFDFKGVGIYNRDERFSEAILSDLDYQEAHAKQLAKAQKFISTYGGEIYNSYEEIISSPEIDAIYIPLPPALHFKWAKAALEHGKHVLVEKPATISLDDTRKLVEIAKNKNLALHENYMFLYHSQLDTIDRIIASDEIGDIRLYRISFGFPRRELNDFRYHKSLGGGALIDAGGYTIQYATRLLGKSARLVYAQSNFIDEFDVDIYGSAAMINDRGITVQIAFGMDNNYRCELEAWGSAGVLTTGRVLTAPPGFSPIALIRRGNENRNVNLPEDDAFLKSILFFEKCISNSVTRENRYRSIVWQAELVDEFEKLSSLKLN